jgi:hypothetical protein
MRRRRRLRPRFFLVLIVILGVILVVGRPHSTADHPPPLAQGLTTAHRPRKASRPWHWVRAGTLPAPTEGLTATVGAGDLLAIGGYAPGGSVTTVTAIGPTPLRLSLPTPVHDAASAVLGDTLYVFGGGSTVAIPTVQAIALGATPASPARPLPEPLSDLGAVTHAGYVYLVGGYTGSAWSNQVWRWTPRQGISALTTLPTGLRYAGVAWYDGRIIVAGGLAPGSAYSDAVYAIDPGTGHVTRWPPLPVSVAYPGLAVLDGRLYLAGGLTVSGPTDAVWEYDPHQRTWVAAPALPVGTYYGALVAYGGHLWYLGGRTPSGLTATVWRSGG